MAARAEMEPLLRREWEAASEDKALFPFDPAWDRCEAIEKMGLVRLFTARSSGVLVGYVGYIVASGLHSQRVMKATSDIMWIEPHARNGGAAKRLLTFAEENLREEGLVMMHTLTNEDHPGLARLLESRGHICVGRIWSLKLRETEHA